jgi:hypothetical protein
MMDTAAEQALVGTTWPLSFQGPTWHACSHVRPMRVSTNLGRQGRNRRRTSTCVRPPHTGPYQVAIPRPIGVAVMCGWPPTSGRSKITASSWSKVSVKGAYRARPQLPSSHDGCGALPRTMARHGRARRTRACRVSRDRSGPRQRRSADPVSSLDDQGHDGPPRRHLRPIQPHAGARPLR